MGFAYVQSLLKIKIVICRRLNLKTYEHNFRHSHLENVDLPLNIILLTDFSHYINVVSVVLSNCTDRLGVQIKTMFKKKTKQKKIFQIFICLGVSCDLPFHKMFSFA